MEAKRIHDGSAASAFREHHRTIYCYLRRKTGDADEAEELAADVFADAVTALRDAGPSESPVLALLYTIAKRRFADSARRRGRRLLHSIPWEAVAGEVAQHPHDEALTGALRRALDRLPPDAAAIVAMKLIQARPFAEISCELGVSEVACRKRYVRGLAMLRAALAEEGFGG